MSQLSFNDLLNRVPLNDIKRILRDDTLDEVQILVLLLVHGGVVSPPIEGSEEDVEREVNFMISKGYLKYIRQLKHEFKDGI